MKHRNSKDCPYCRSTGKQYFVYNDIAFFQCRQCDLVFKDDSRDGMDYLFEEHARDQISGIRDALYRSILDEIEKEIRIGMMLDVGCGCGSFLKFAMDRGWQGKGIDPSHEAVAYSRTFCGDLTVQGTLRDLDGRERYDVITMINVLDHTAKPWDETRRAFSLLKNNGLLYLRFPNGGFHQVLWRKMPPFIFWNLIHKQCIFHQYSFTGHYIHQLLSSQGYRNIVARNAAISGDLKPFLPGKEGLNQILKGSILFGLKLFDVCFGDRVLWGPSMTVIARKR